MLHYAAIRPYYQNKEYDYFIAGYFIIKSVNDDPLNKRFLVFFC
jgi:hypothetical protein